VSGMPAWVGERSRRGRVTMPGSFSTTGQAGTLCAWLGPLQYMLIFTWLIYYNRVFFAGSLFYDDGDVRQCSIVRER
jgi:hypothetical protein